MVTYGCVSLWVVLYRCSPGNLPHVSKLVNQPIKVKGWKGHEVGRALRGRPRAPWSTTGSIGPLLELRHILDPPMARKSPPYRLSGHNGKDRNQDTATPGQQARQESSSLMGGAARGCGAPGPESPQSQSPDLARRSETFGGLASHAQLFPRNIGYLKPLWLDNSYRWPSGIGAACNEHLED